MADETALKIFNLAKDGIYNPIEATRELGLTQQNYYMNLRRLIGAGLIERKKSPIFIPN